MNKLRGIVNIYEVGGIFNSVMNKFLKVLSLASDMNMIMICQGTKWERKKKYNSCPSVLHLVLYV